MGQICNGALSTFLILGSVYWHMKQDAAPENIERDIEYISATWVCLLAH